MPGAGRRGALEVLHRAQLLAPGECVAAHDAELRAGTAVEMHLHDV